MNQLNKYSVNKASELDIYKHITICDKSFSPSLSSRVNLKNYAAKMHKKSVCFESWEKDNLIGLISIYCNNKFINEAYITNVSIIPKYRKNKIASQLLFMCIQYIKELNIDSINLEVEKKNIIAIEFYKKFNFTLLKNKSEFVKMKLCFFKEKNEK